MEGKNTNKNSLTFSIINKPDLSAVLPSSTYAEQQHLLERFEGKKKKGDEKVLEEITLEEEGKDGRRKKCGEVKKEDVEQATKLTRDEDSRFADKSRSAESGMEQKWKRMKRREKRNEEEKRIECCNGKEDTSYGKKMGRKENHISFNSTTLDPINRNFAVERKVKEEEERIEGRETRRIREEEGIEGETRRERIREDVSDMNNLPVITSNQEDEEGKEKPLSLPLTQSNVPLIHHSLPLIHHSLPLNPSSFLGEDKGRGGREERLVDTSLSAQSEPVSFLNHITEPDEIFFHDMGSSSANPAGGIRVGNVNRDITSKLKYSSDGSRSWLYFTPTSKYDFGSFECWATNSIGKQSFPCLFTINAAGKEMQFIIQFIIQSISHPRFPSFHTFLLRIYE